MRMFEQVSSIKKLWFILYLLGFMFPSYLEYWFDGGPTGVAPHVDHHCEAQLPHVVTETNIVQ